MCNAGYAGQTSRQACENGTLDTPEACDKRGVLRRVAECCSVLQHVSACKNDTLDMLAACFDGDVLQRVACSVLPAV